MRRLLFWTAVVLLLSTPAAFGDQISKPNPPKRFDIPEAQAVADLERKRIWQEYVARRKARRDRARAIRYRQTRPGAYMIPNSQLIIPRPEGGLWVGGKAR